MLFNLPTSVRKTPTQNKKKSKAGKKTHLLNTSKEQMYIVSSIYCSF